MSFYFCKLVPPRPDFAQTMTEKEMQAMKEHSLYWQERAKENIPLAVGLVADPKGFYGIGILEFQDEEQLKQILDNDPAIKANMGAHYEYYFMPRGVVHR